MRFYLEGNRREGYYLTSCTNQMFIDLNSPRNIKFYWLGPSLSVKLCYRTDSSFNYDTKKEAKRVYKKYKEKLRNDSCIS